MSSRDVQSIVCTFANTGIILKSAPDEIPITAYKMLSNAHTDRENSVSVRKGFVRMNAGLSAPPYSSYFLKDANNRQWRYAITNGQLYVAPVVNPVDASVWPLASGTDFGAVTGGNNLSSDNDPRALWTTMSLQGTEMKPFIFMADGKAFLMHSGGMASARRVGIPRPANPITGVTLLATIDSFIEGFEDYTQWAGGSSTIITAADYPSIWFNGDSDLSSRWYYAKYSFVLSDGSESFCSASNYPRYIPRLKASRMFWKKAKTSYEALPAAHPSHWWGSETPFDDSTYASIPGGARVYKIKIGAGTRIDRIQFVWQTVDGTLINGPVHGGSGGTSYEFILASDEYITEFKGRYGSMFMDTLIIVTNKRESPVYGTEHGDTDYSITMPDEEALRSPCLIGLNGRTYLDSGQATPILTGFGFVVRWDTYDTTSTAPGTAVGWNLYVGSSKDSLSRVNSTPIDLVSIFNEPATGFVYSAIEPLIPNAGILTDDPSGETGHALMMTVTGSDKFGSALKTFKDSNGDAIIKNFGDQSPEESFKISVKFSDADSITNCDKIRLKFVLSDIPGDTGGKYKYFAVAEKTDFSSFTPGVFQQIQFFKSDFAFNNNSGSTLDDIDWTTVSAVAVELITIDPVTGSNSCSISFDNLIYSPTGKLSGVDLEWTYTFYDSITDTESDYADAFANNTGTLTNAQVILSFPATPATTPPMANPDKIRIYRMGGTLEQFQLIAEIDYIEGFAFTWTDNVSDIDAGDVLEEDNQLPPEEVEGCEIWDDRMWTWGGVGLDGIQEPLNRLRFSKGTRVNLFPSENYIYIGSGNEEIRRVLEHDGELFIFTTTTVYRIVGSGSDSSYKAQSTSVKQGLINKFDACRGVRGLYMRAYDGIYEFPNGRKISESINPIFFGENVNGIEPVAAGREMEEAMGFSDSKLMFSYCSTTDPSIRNDRMLVWDTLYERWSWRIYGAQNLFFEPETNILIGDNLTQWYSVIPGVPVTVRRSGNYPIHLDYGNGDQCSDPTTGDLIVYGIPVIIDTKEYDLGYPDQEKQFIELIVDADTQGYPVTLQATFDGGEFEPIGTIQTAVRQRVAFAITMEDSNSYMAVRMSLRLQFESDPNADASTRIYKIVHRVLLEPPRRRTHVTDWDSVGIEGDKYFRQLRIEMDTFGHPLEKIEVEVDHQIIKTITENISSDGRHQFYYGLGIDQRGSIGRVKIYTDGDWEVKVYSLSFDVIPEPTLINSIQLPWTDNGFPYRKLWKQIELDIDTAGKLIQFDFWLDKEIVQSFQVVTDARQKVVQSLNAELFGKIGRVTVDVDILGTDGIPQGVRLYGDPLYVTDQRNPDVTLADSFEQVLAYERKKIVKQMWYVVENPNADVQLDLYIDNILKGSFTIPLNGSLYPKFSVRRMDFNSAFKGKLFRYVFSSTQAFEIDWARTHIVLRDVNTEETHRRPELNPPATY
jgi:hypothetical protein